MVAARDIDLSQILTSSHLHQDRTLHSLTCINPYLQLSPGLGLRFRSLREHCWPHFSLQATEQTHHLCLQRPGPSWCVWSCSHPPLPHHTALASDPVELRDAQTTVPALPGPTAVLISRADCVPPYLWGEPLCKYCCKFFGFPSKSCCSFNAFLVRPACPTPSH